MLSAILAAVVFLSLGIGIGWGLTSGHNGSPAAKAPLSAAAPANPSTNGSGQSLNLQAITAKVDPAVVDVNTYIRVNPFGNSGSGQLRAAGAGTGMIVTSSGEVLTNNHVIEGATRIQVTIQGRSGTYLATVLGADPTDDVALIQVQGVSGLPTVTIANSSSLSVGQSVVAIGNALGKGGTPSATQGTVTALGRSISVGDDRGGVEQLKDMIQTNASIQPGDSGGPLVNSAGQVVGMITAAARSTGFDSGSSVGFAIPSSTALNIVNEVRAGHSSSTIIIGQAGFIGIEVQDLDAATAARLGLSVNSGALVVGVESGTPAARAGITQNSVVTAVDGKTIRSSSALGPLIHTHKPGEQIRVTWIDPSGTTHTATITLIAGPAV